MYFMTVYQMTLKVYYIDEFAEKRLFYFPLKSFYVVLQYTLKCSC